MAVHQQKSVILPRILGLRDHSPFILFLDTVAQSSRYLELEFFHRVPKDANLIYLSYETFKVPERANRKIECTKKSSKQIHEAVQAALQSATKNVIYIDTLAYLKSEELTSFLMPLLGPQSSLVATFHTDIPSAKSANPNSCYPSALTLLSYFATAVVNVWPLPKDDVNDEQDRLRLVERFILPALSCNQPVFQAVLTHRRKSGRAIEATYVINSKTHEINYIIPKKPEEEASAAAEDEQLLKGLTTFNLTTTDKQRAAKDKVDLPYLQAQEVGQGGAKGGAIIYEFEKDDDYDEEDPYEDPF